MGWEQLVQARQSHCETYEVQQCRAYSARLTATTLVLSSHCLHRVSNTGTTSVKVAWAPERSFYPRIGGKFKIKFYKSNSKDLIRGFRLMRSYWIQPDPLKIQWIADSGIS